MAAVHSHALFPQFSPHTVRSISPRTLPCSFSFHDHSIQLVCHGYPSKSSNYISASCGISMHESTDVQERPRLKDTEPWELTGHLETIFSGTSTAAEQDRLTSSGIEGASHTNGACATHLSVGNDIRFTAKGRPLNEDASSLELFTASPCVSMSNASTLAASYKGIESPHSPLSSAGSSPQTRSKVVRTAWEALVRWSRSWQLLNARKATNVLQQTKKVVVVGGGSFGTAMAVLLARNKAEIKYFPRHVLPRNIIATTDPQEAFKDSEYCIHALPVQHSADYLKCITEYVSPSLPFFSVSKGLELSSLEMMSQVIPRALGNPRQPIAVISGPSFAIELMDELPTAMVAASREKKLANAAQQLFASRYLRINTSSDVIGVEIAGALKNVLAIAAGIVEGMNLGNNCMAALVSQGCSEIRWLAEKMGAKSTTLAGLSGTGDIMLTCFVSLSRNRSVGVRLGSGESLSDILSSMNQVAEGVATAGAVIALARKYRVQMPVLTAVARILENELTPKRAVLELMSLPQVEEV
ncbi:hypothetical protein KP509_12G048500 [Ceratopteris richardii]|uniref:Glycerol-3-phosphate dehydrogenase [NAD(+)] n=1 Tax=Ceratopteris richardii TaxID=49495 RepID=A0A8T2TIX8_CERRI|nr:hypothetical protein KP509_12G048500 [Ceratopteris richardii]